MFEEFVPKKKVGFLSPLNIIENQPYEFYQHASPGVMLVMEPVGLTEFSKADADRVYEPVDKLVDTLMERGVDLLIMGGVPLPLLLGIEGHDRLLQRMAERSGVPAISQITSVSAAAQHLGISRLALVNKWTPEMNAALGAFLARDGIAVAGVTNEDLAPAEFQQMSTSNGMELAYRLGKRALEEVPDADGLFIGGGAWLSLPVTCALEAEFGKPVLCNPSAMMWNVLNMVGMWRPLTGRGRLMACD